MRAVVQRVSEASVSISENVVGAWGPGYLVLLGVGESDTEAEVEQLWNKIFKLRIFPDGEHHTGASPSFTNAGDPAESERLYELFVERARRDVTHVATGEFGADMQVALVNDGPFTICLDTDDLKRPRKR